MAINSIPSFTTPIVHKIEALREASTQLQALQQRGLSILNTSFISALKQIQNYSAQLNSAKTPELEYTPLVERVEWICNELIPSRLSAIKTELEKDLNECTFKTAEFSQEFWSLSNNIDTLNQLLSPEGFMNFYRNK